MEPRRDLPLLSALMLLCIPQMAWAGVSNLCKLHYPSDDKAAWQCYRIQSGETLESLYGDAWREVARFNRIDRRHARPGVRLKVPQDLADVKDFTAMPQQYPAAEKEAKFILVDLSEQFLGGYEYGKLVLSAPIASGAYRHETPTGKYRVTAFHDQHKSSLYKIRKTRIPYPMHYALMFHVNTNGVAFWMHGRDVPGYPASHGCIGLYDEEMQKKYYKYPAKPVLEDARNLYEWVISPGIEIKGLNSLKNGPKVWVVGKTPKS